MCRVAVAVGVVQLHELVEAVLAVGSVLGMAEDVIRRGIQSRGPSLIPCFRTGRGRVAEGGEMSARWPSGGACPTIPRPTWGRYHGGPRRQSTQTAGVAQCWRRFRRNHFGRWLGGMLRRCPGFCRTMTVLLAPNSSRKTMTEGSRVAASVKR